MNVRAVSEMMNGTERNAEVPAETDRPEALAADPRAPVETGEAKALTAEPGAPLDCAAGVPAPQRAWTPRSRETIREEQRLKKELAAREAQEATAVGMLESATEEKERMLRLSIGGEAWAGDALAKTLLKMDNARRLVEVYTEEAEKAQANLDGFCASVAAGAAYRAQTQEKLAELAVALVGIAAESQALLDELYKILKLRQELASLMQRLASTIELRCDSEAGIPASFVESLSFDLLSASAAWKAVFLGESEKLTAYVVVDKEFEVAETLAQSGVLSFGETVYLPEEEARELLRNDRPAPGGFGWACLPPTLMTVEAFAAAKAEAGPMGSMMQYFLQQKHGELEQKRREAYLLERRGTPVPGVHLGGAH